MRKIAYILSLAAMFLAAMTLLTTNLLASDGDSFNQLSHQYQGQQERVDELARQVMEAQSITSVRQRAAKMGFISSAK